MPLHAHEPTRDAERVSIRPQLARPGLPEIPRFRLADDSVPAEIAYQVVHDELLLDGNARLNLATFVTTWMEPEARQVMAECLDKNMIDKDEYPRTAELERRCVNILAELWHAESSGSTATGCSTTGSSEAGMLGGLALTWRWRRRQLAAGRRTDRPNLVMGSNVQVCWEKFCRYWDVEAREVPVGPHVAHLTPAGVLAHCDENTVGVVAVLGSTYDGSYEPVADIAAALDGLEAETGLDVPIHVDAASGGFIAPFLDPELPWDFRLERVQSINASGHKYGLVYPGVGWVVWRDAEGLPRELVFDVDYLGGHMPTFALNFSRPGAQVAAQYYMFLRLGHDGYRRVQQQCRDVARWLAGAVEALGPFRLVAQGDELPVVAFALDRPDSLGDATVYDVSEQLRVHGWLVPAYPMPPEMEDLSVLRVVVRNGFSADMAEMFMESLGAVVERLRHGPGTAAPRSGFHH